MSNLSPEFVKTAENVAVFDPKTEETYVFDGVEPRLIDWDDLDTIRARGGVVVASEDAHDIFLKSDKPITPEAVLNFYSDRRDDSEMQSAIGYWERRRELAKLVGDTSLEDYKNTVWVSCGLGYFEERHVFENGMPLVMPDFEYIPKLTIVVPQTDGFERYFKMANKKVEKFGYLEELEPEKVNYNMKHGSRLIYPELLRSTYESFGVVTEQTLKWQAKLDYEKFELKFLLKKLVSKLKDSEVLPQQFA